jgi:hypothetical protein
MPASPSTFEITSTPNGYYVSVRSVHLLLNRYNVVFVVAVPLFVMKDAPHGKGLLITGGYNQVKIEEIEHAKEANDVGGKRSRGFGSLDGETDMETEHESEFVEKHFLRAPTTKEVRLLHRFVYEATVKTSSRILKCLKCKEQIGPSTSPFDDVESTFSHVHRLHPELFSDWLTRLRGKLGCGEDHDGMVNRHAGGSVPMYCGMCGKLLWKPARVRTHTPGEASLEVSNSV